MERAKDIFEKIIKNGEIAIDELIVTRRFEELFLDFKRSADNGSGRNLHQNDRDNLAKAISGFGNSEGGVIVWGVHCSKDIDYADLPTAKFPIQNAKRFASWLEGAISGCTIPPHIGIKHHVIDIKEKGDGFVITYIPKSYRAPHQTTKKLQYYIRAGSSFVPAPHSVLAGMFGRRPQPDVFHTFLTEPAELKDNKIKCSMNFLITNQGPGIATDLFINVIASSVPSNNCDLTFESLDPNNWNYIFFMKQKMDVICKKELRLAPEAQVGPLRINIFFAPPFSKKLKIEGICGCGQSPPYRFTIERNPKSIEKLYNDFLTKNNNGLLGPKEKINFSKKIWSTSTYKRINE